MKTHLLAAAAVAILGASAMAAPAAAESYNSAFYALYSPAAPPVLERTQLYVWGGRNYCFYVDGWHGPGWYWCGYRYRRGFGWGGGDGFHGWHGGGGHFHGGGRFHGGGHGHGGGGHGGGGGGHHH